MEPASRLKKCACVQRKRLMNDKSWLQRARVQRGTPPGYCRVTRGHSTSGRLRAPRPPSRPLPPHFRPSLVLSFMFHAAEMLRTASGQAHRKFTAGCTGLSLSHRHYRDPLSDDQLTAGSHAARTRGRRDLVLPAAASPVPVLRSELVALSQGTGTLPRAGCPVPGHRAWCPGQFLHSLGKASSQLGG